MLKRRFTDVWGFEQKTVRRPDYNTFEHLRRTTVPKSKLSFIECLDYLFRGSLEFVETITVVFSRKYSRFPTHCMVVKSVVVQLKF